MKRAVLLALTASASLWADPEGALLEKLYAKLADSFSSGRALGKGGDYLLLASPGLPVTRNDCADAYVISMAADLIPLPTLNYRPSGFFYSTTYSDILDHAETSRFQNMADREKARKARRLFFDKNRPGQPTQAYAEYLKGQAAWCSARDALTMAQTNLQVFGTAVPPGLEPAVAAAMKNWEDKGHKKELEDAQADLDHFYDENVGALFTGLRDDFLLAKTSDAHPTEWYPVTATPPPEEWLSDKDWKPFSLTQPEKNLAQGPASLPLGAKGAQAAKAPDDMASSVSITLETKRVGLARPWLDTGIFKGHGWRLQGKSGFKMVSTGNPSDREPGLMPLLVTGVLLSRKLVLTGHWQATAVKALGPFSLQGTPTSRNGQMSLAVEGAQIIGFFCTTVPRSPDPDEKAFRTKRD